MNSRLLTFWRNNKSIILFISLMCVFRSAVADWNDVPTGSMQPTIAVGDRILINKLAYDIRVPFTRVSLVKLADPERGDIIIFESERAGNRLVKRVVGVPGDVVALQDNVLYLNGKPLQYELQQEHTGYADYREDLAGIAHTIRLMATPSSLHNFKPVTVPDGYYLAMGDNRDNSADSRVIGFIPRDEIIGRSRHVVMSLDHDNYYLPRTDRFWHTL